MHAYRVKVVLYSRGVEEEVFNVYARIGGHGVAGQSGQRGVEGRAHLRGWHLRQDRTGQR